MSALLDDDFRLALWNVRDPTPFKEAPIRIEDNEGNGGENLKRSSAAMQRRPHIFGGSDK
jgi:hypothetical protein